MINIDEILKRISDNERYPFNSPLMDVATGVSVPRYWYHTPRARRSVWGDLRAYKIRELEAASAFGKDRDKYKYIWMAKQPRFGRPCYIIDISKLDNNNMRFTGQAEGHMLHRGDIPRSAIVGAIVEDTKNYHQDKYKWM